MNRMCFKSLLLSLLMLSSVLEQASFHLCADPLKGHSALGLEEGGSRHTRKKSKMNWLLYGGIMCSIVQNCYTYLSLSHHLGDELGYDKRQRKRHLRGEDVKYLSEDLSFQAWSRHMRVNDTDPQVASLELWKADCLTKDDRIGVRCAESECFEFDESVDCSDYNLALQAKQVKCQCPKTGLRGYAANDRPIEVTLIVMQDASSDQLADAVEQILEKSQGLNIKIYVLGEPIDFDHQNVSMIDQDSDDEGHIQQLRENYLHNSYKTIKEERLGMERWLSLANFLTQSKIETPIFVVESDFVFFEQLSLIIRKIKDQVFAGTFNDYNGKISSVLTQFVMFKDRTIVEAFARDILNLYKKNHSDLDAQLESIAEKGAGGQKQVSDAQLLGRFVMDHFYHNKSMIYNFHQPFEGHKRRVVISHFNDVFSQFSFQDGVMTTEQYERWGETYRDFSPLAIHYEHLSKELHSFVAQSIADSYSNRSIYCHSYKDLYLRGVGQHIYCSYQRVDEEHSNTSRSKMYYGSTDPFLQKLKLAKAVPEKYRQNIDLQRFVFVSLPGVSDPSAWIAQGAYGTVFLVFDCRDHKLKVAKFLRDDLDARLRDEALRVNQYEVKLASEWKRAVGNSLEMEKIGSTIIKTFIHGPSLHEILLSGSLFDPSLEAKERKSRLIQLFHKMFIKKRLITDLNASNLIYKNNEWVIVDGDGIKEFDEMESMFEEIKSCFSFNVKYSHVHNHSLSQSKKHDFYNQSKMLVDEIIRSYKK